MKFIATLAILIATQLITGNSLNLRSGINEAEAAYEYTIGYNAY